MILLIDLSSVSKIYKMGKIYVEALKDINMRVERGEFISIMGPSGSGKSTLLHLIGALDRPTTGIIHIDGLDITKVPERKLAKFRRENIGFIFQFFYLVPTLNALENVMLPLLPIKPRWLKDKALELLNEVGLGDRINHKPSELSGGEQQRVAIARALINDPKIIIADEPTGNLDSKTGMKVVELLKDVSKRKNKTLIMATHNMEIAKKADRIIYLRDGEIIGEEKIVTSAIG